MILVQLTGSIKVADSYGRTRLLHDGKQYDGSNVSNVTGSCALFIKHAVFLPVFGP